MNFTVRKLILLQLIVLLDIIYKHCNHTRLLLFNIKKLDESISEEIFKLPFFLEDLLNMLFLELDLVVFDDKHGSQTPSRVCVDLDLPLVDISTDRVLFRKLVTLVTSPHLPDLSEKLAGIVVVTDPLAVQEDLVRLGVLIVVVWSQRLDSEVVERLNELKWLLADRDLCHQGQILDKTAGTSLWCFCGTHHTPMGVVELSGLCCLSFLVERCRYSSQVRQERGKSKSIEHLRDSCFKNVVVLIFAPISSGKRGTKTTSDSFRFDVLFESQAFGIELLTVNILLQVLLHVRDHLSELHSEDHFQQCSSHIQSLLSVVISIVFGRSSKVGLEKSVGHVTSEIGFLELVTLGDADMRKHVRLENFTSESESLVSVVLMDGSTELSNIIKTIILALVPDCILKGWSECLLHSSVCWIGEHHVHDLLLAVATKGSEQDDDRYHISDLWDAGVNLTSSVRLSYLELELEGRLAALLILRPDLCVPRESTLGQLVVENEHDVARLSLLRNDDLL